MGACDVHMGSASPTASLAAISGDDLARRLVSRTLAELGTDSSALKGELHLTSTSVVMQKVPAKVPTIGFSVLRWWLRPSSVSPARSSFMASSSAEKPRRRHHLPTRLQVCLAFKT